MSAVTTHVLDTSSGRPAQDVAVTLERMADRGWSASPCRWALSARLVRSRRQIPR